MIACDFLSVLKAFELSCKITSQHPQITALLTIIQLNVLIQNQIYFKILKVGDRRVRIFSAHNNWWAILVINAVFKPHARTYFSDFLRQGVQTIGEDNV